MPSCSRTSIFAYLDDIYIICNPERAVEVFDVVAPALEHHAGIRINLGKTKMWNAAGVKPVGVDDLAAKVRVGNGISSKQGMVVLGTPVGHKDFVNAWLDNLTHEHKTLLKRIRMMQDSQCAWMVLSMCAAPRAWFMRCEMSRRQ